MKISDIKQQAKRADRYSVYIDGKYSCSFSEGELLELGLRVGQELSKPDLVELKANAAKDKAYDRSLGLISRRPRSEWELREYLKRKETPPEIADAAIDRLRQRGYVNDEDFAKRWVDNRRLLKATSRRRLSMELRQKRVADEIIDQVLSEDTTDEREVLRELIERKRKQIKYQDNLKLMQYLSRQGYGYDDIKSVLGETVE
jgi:regulatory protein